MEIRITTAAQFKHDVGPGGEGMYVVLFVTRNEVEQGLVGSAVERLMEITDCPVNTANFAGRVCTIVDGYDADRRELIEIPEVRTFFQKVDEQWPYFGWFACELSQDVQRLLCMTVECTIQRAGSRVLLMPNERDVKAQIAKWLRAVERLGEQYGLQAIASQRCALLQTFIAAL